MAKKDTPDDLIRYAAMIGANVHKRYSGKPFKSGYKINTVSGIFGTHPTSGRLCFTFIEDVSYVECFRCGEVAWQ
jgi:hypothetical protein